MTLSLHAEREKLEASMVIAGGISLGAYEAGYNWAMINIKIKHKERLLITPHMAWTSIEARKKLLEGIVENISNFLGNTQGGYIHPARRIAKR